MRLLPTTLALLGYALALLPHAIADPVDLAPLREIAARHGMPMPPAHARPILVHTHMWLGLSNPSGSRDPGIYTPAFLDEHEAGEHVAILCGGERVEHSRDFLVGDDTRPFSSESPEPVLGGYVIDFDQPSVVLCALQLSARGDDVAAQALWQRFTAGRYWQELRDEPLGRESPDRALAKQLADPCGLVAHCLLRHWMDTVALGPSAWVEAHRRLTALLVEFPALKSEAAGLLDDLGTTLAAPVPARGSVEAQLLAWAQLPTDDTHRDVFDDAAPACELQRGILLRGADAVEALVPLLADRRLTAQVKAPSGVSMGPASHVVHFVRVGEPPPAAAP